jgi:hypothetical protein
LSRTFFREALNRLRIVNDFSTGSSAKTENAQTDAFCRHAASILKIMRMGAMADFGVDCLVIIVVIIL